MAYYGYKREMGMKRDIDSAVPGVTNVFLLSDGTLRVDFADDLDAYRKGCLDDIMASRGYSPISEPTDVLLESVVTKPVSVSSFEDAKIVKLIAIDLHTDALIALGYKFQGVNFPLTLEHQLRLEGSDRARNDPAYEYPVMWNSSDNKDHLNIPDAVTLHNLYLTALGTLRARVDSGSELKALVRDAATQDELDAIVDDRS